MNCDDASTWQLDRIREAVGRHLPTLRGITHALDRRIPGTSVAKAADEAYSAARGLWVTAHHLACASGVGRPARTVRTSSGPFAAWANWNPPR